MNLEHFIDLIDRSSPPDWVTVGGTTVFLQGRDNEAALDQSPNTRTDYVWPRHDTVHTLRSDLSISIATGMIDGDFDDAAWMANSGARVGNTEAVDFLWNGRPVVRAYRVWIDGRWSMPLDGDGREVSERLLRILRLVNEIEDVAGASDFADGFNRCVSKVGLVAVDRPWPR